MIINSYRPFSIIITLFAFIVLWGCATPLKTASDVQSGCRLKEDPYEKTTWISSPYQFVFDNPSYLIRVLVKDNDVAFYQLYIDEIFSEWAFIDSAHDIQGRSFDVVEIKREVTQSASVREIVGVELSRNYLDEAAVSGINMKLKGRYGSAIAQVPAFYVKGFLQCVDDYLR